jgi:CHAD domain-containing protein
MVTTEASKTTPVPISPQTEHDKLGPLGGKKPVLHDPSELRAALIDEFRDAAEHARNAAAAADKNIVTAVHDCRKALRRARAVLSMIADALPKSERRAVKAALQQARRALSVARDYAVAPETLSHLTLGAEQRATADAVLKNAKEAMPPADETKRAIVDAASRAVAQAAALDAALPREIEWSVVADGVRTVYDEARRARRRAKRSKRAFHSWRRRGKELSYQLEILKSYAGERVGLIHAEIDGVTDQLSPAVDEIMLREFVETYGQGIAPDALDSLVVSIDGELGDLMTASRKAGRDAYRRGGGKFEKRLSRAVKRDLAPPEPAAAS